MKQLLISLILVLVVSCGTELDPLVRAINGDLEPEVTYFDIEVNDRDRDDIYPRDTLNLIWQVNGAYLFDIRFYLSEDREISTEDIVIIDEYCNGINVNCDNNTRITYDCDYNNSNRLECSSVYEDLRDSDLSPLLDTLPKDLFVIIEACNDGECDTDIIDVTFH